MTQVPEIKKPPVDKTKLDPRLKRRVQKKQIKKDMDIIFKWTSDDDDRKMMILHYLTDGKKDIYGMLGLFSEPCRWGVYQNSTYRRSLGAMTSGGAGWRLINDVNESKEETEFSQELLDEDIQEFDFDSAVNVEIALRKMQIGIQPSGVSSITDFIKKEITKGSISIL